MCGIAGLLCSISLQVGPLPSSTQQAAAGVWNTEKSVIESMVATMRHRGPNDRGIWATTIGDWQLWLGHTRLAILDLTPAASQPMIDADSGCILVYNGEIYNFEELRSELLAEGVAPFGSTGDTQVLLRAYVHWGPAFVRKLRGMFAFAIYDPCQQQIFLARDHFGIKPLYFTWGPGGSFAFASEVRTLLEVPWVQRSLDPLGLKSFLDYGSVQDPFTLISGIRAVPAGHTLTIDLAKDLPRLEGPKPFWQLLAINHEETVTLEEAGRQLRSALVESVRLHMISDVPLGVFLSGGVDSSSLLALMAEVSSSQAHSLTISFEETEYDESEAARAVAKIYAARHTDIKLTAKDFLRGFPTWIDSLDQPSMDGANIWVISKACKQAGMTVALSGLGADELFGGYPTFRRTAKAAMLFKSIGWLPHAVRCLLADVVCEAANHSIVGEKLSAWIESNGSSLSTYLIQRRVFLPRAYPQLINPGVMDLMGNSDLYPQLLENLESLAGNEGIYRAVGLFEMSTYMVNTILRDTDQMGMAHSIEIRVPFVDRNIAELVLALPEKICFPKHGKKALLYEAMKDRLDPASWNRPKKTFSFPFDEWLRGTMREEVASGLRSIDGNTFNPQGIANVWYRFLEKKRQINSSQILMLYALGA